MLQQWQYFQPYFSTSPSSCPRTISKNRRGVKQPCSSVGQRQGEIELVDRTSQLMEPSEPSSSNQLDKNNIRCLSLGMESSLQQCNNKMTLVPERNFLSNQLPGDVSSLLALLSFTKDLPTSSNSLSLHGQYFSHFLLQSQRRDNITIPLQSSQGDLAMVHVSEHLTMVANHLPGHLTMVADAD